MIKDKVKFNCSFCNKDIFRVPYWTGKRTNYFCSRYCYFEFCRKGEYKNCYVCNKEIYYTPAMLRDIKGNKYFCSYKCNGVYLSKKVECKCSACSVLFHAKLSVVKLGRALFCSTACRGISQSGDKNHFWKGGHKPTPYGKGFTKVLKNTIKERDGFKCMICKAPKIECIYPLVVHHIDYDKNNHSPENLITLCNSCHTKTNHNRATWLIYFKEKKYLCV